MDGGNVLGQREVEINKFETAGELHDRLALLGPEIIGEVLAGDFTGEEQEETEVTYAPKISRSNATIDFTQSATTIANMIRGYSPWPGCHMSISGVDCKILNAIPKEGIGELGEVLEDGTIAVGEGSIEILQLKPAGSTTMSWKDFCNGRSIQTGDICKVRR
jgi:methionyl-tRNA formyltransferase